MRQILFSVVIASIFQLLMSGCLSLTSTSSEIATENFKGREFAHRGGYQWGPENTLETVAATLKRGYHNIEVDVQLSKDGQLVLMHDEKIDRTTNGKGNVKDLSLTKIQQFKIRFKGSPIDARVPSLSEFLAMLSEDLVFVELDFKHTIERHDLAAQRLIEVMEVCNCYDRIYVSSFDPYMLYIIKEQEPRIVTALSVRKNATGSAWKDIILESDTLPAWLGVSIIEPHRNMVNEKSVQAWRELGLVVIAWTLNTRSDKERLRRLGVGFVSNCPGSFCADDDSDAI